MYFVKLFLFYYFILCCLFGSKSAEILYGINIPDLEAQYLRIFFDDTLDNIARMRLSVKLSAVQVHLHIDKAIEPLDEFDAELDNSDKKGKKGQEKWQIRKEFEEFCGKLKTKQMIKLVDVCEMWNFGIYVDSAIDALQMAKNSGRLKKLRKNKIHRKKDYNCNEMPKNIVRFYDNQRLKWIDLFYKFLSLKHFLFLTAKFSTAYEAKSDYRAWFRRDRMPNESELAYRFRMLTVKGDLEAIKRVKGYMQVYFLYYDTEMSTLEFNNPLTMAIHVITDDMLYSMYKTVFYMSIEANLSVRLKFSILCGKIINLFKMNCNNEVPNDKISSIWHLFVQTLAHTSSSHAERRNWINKMHEFHENLKIEFGSGASSPPEWRILLKQYEKCFLEIFHEKSPDWPIFVQKKESRQWLKELFKMAEGEENIFSKNFWKILEVTPKSNINFNLNQINEIKLIELEGQPDIYYIPKPYLECNPSRENIEWSNANSITKSGKAFIVLFLELDDQGIKKDGIVDLLETVDLESAIYYYKSSLEDMFEFANNLEHKSEGFSTVLDNYKNEWEIVRKRMPKGHNEQENLCQVYKYSINFVANEILKLENKKWEEHVHNLLNSSVNKFNEEKFIVLPDQTDGTVWSNIDCQSAEDARQLFDTIKMMPWIDRIHFYVLTKLISESSEMRHLFCSGYEPKKLTHWDLKERLRFVVQDKVLLALEERFPEILHFEILIDSQQMHILLEQLHYKTGTIAAEDHEARGVLPEILRLINSHENTLETLEVPPKNQAQISSAIKLALLTKIVSVKSEFYRVLLAQEPNGLRKSVCVLSWFMIFLNKIMKQSDENPFKIESQISEWKAEQCESEELVKYQMFRYRTDMKSFNFEFLERTLRKYEWFRNRIKQTQGARTRLWKTLYDHTGESYNSLGQELLDLWQELDMVNDAFNDDALLRAHYRDTLISPTRDFRTESALKADLINFVRFIEQKLLDPEETGTFKRFAKFWSKKCHMLDALYDQLYDIEDGTMMVAKILFRKLLWELKNFAEESLTKNKSESMENEWEQIILDNLKAKPEELLAFGQMEIYQKIDGWLKNLHYERIKGFLKQYHIFRGMLRKEYSDSMEKILLLVELLGNVEHAEEIVKMCGIDDIIITLEKNNDNEKEEQQKAAKSKKKKAKRKKKKGNGQMVAEQPEYVAEQPEDVAEQPEDVVEHSGASMENGTNVIENVAEYEEGEKITEYLSEHSDNEYASATSNAETVVEHKEINIATNSSSEVANNSAECIAEKVSEDIIETSKITAENTDVTGTNITSIKNNAEMEDATSTVMPVTIAPKVAETRTASELKKLENMDVDEEEEKINLAKFEGINRLSDFSNDKILALKYCKFLKVLLNKKFKILESSVGYLRMSNIGDSKKSDGENSRKIDENSMTKLLDIGIYVNEITHRIEAMKQLDIVMDSGQFSDDISNLEEEYDKLTKDTVIRPWKLLQQLHKLLTRIVAKMDDFTAKNSAENLGKIKEQFHFRKLSMTIVRCKLWWNQLGNMEKQMVLDKLIGQTDNENDDDLMEKFEKYLFWYKKMEAQRNLDKNLYEKYRREINFVDEKELPTFLSANLDAFPEGWQEIKFDDQMAKMEEKSAEMQLIFKANGFTDQEFDGNNLKSLMKGLRKIFVEWNPDVRLQFPSVHYLSNKNKSNLKTICILPDGFNWAKIFGKLECNLNFRKLCQERTLHCIFCKNSAVSNIQKFPKDKYNLIPKIKIEVFNAEIEIKFVIIPQIPQLPRILNYNAKQLGIFSKFITEEIDKYMDEGFNESTDRKIEKLTEEALQRAEASKKQYEIEILRRDVKIAKDNRQNSLIRQERVKELKLTLSTINEHGIYLKLLEFLLTKKELFKLQAEEIAEDVLDGENLQKFRTILDCVKLWAKNAYLFNGTIGYLDTIILAIMLTKVFLLYPLATMPFLVEKFFLTYASWNWPLPVQLSEIISAKSGEFLQWHPGREWIETKKQFLPDNLGKTIQNKMAMPIIVPMFPEQNSAKINLSTAKVIQVELKRALRRIKQTENPVDSINAPLEVKRFTDKYGHFILVYCVGPEISIRKFCDFIGENLRHELAFFMDKYWANAIEFCHIYPSWIMADQCLVEESLTSNKLRKRLWMIGVQLVAGQKNSAFKSTLRGKLRKKFGVRSKADFERGDFYNVQIKTDYVDREELDAVCEMEWP